MKTNPSETPSIVNFTLNHLPEVLKICADELGADYHSRDDFIRSVENNDYICKVSLNSKGNVIGFFITMVLDPVEADEYLKLPDSEAREKLLSVNRIGILDSEAIESSFKRKGIGRELLKAGYKELLKINPDVVCGMAWKKANGITNVQKVIMEMGLERSLEIQGYWNLVSNEPNGHVCPVCITPPCKCFGVLYTQYM